jgi:hypothetical protein
MACARYRRSTAFHEAGHAVVAWSFGLTVDAVWVNADDASGGASISPVDHLTLAEQIAVWWSGTAAESVFDCQSHEYAAFEDHVRGMELLEVHGISEEEHGPALRAEALSIATARLEANKTRVIELTERLAVDGRVDASEFLQLMNGLGDPR